jgi:hypothetical protein
VDEESKSRLVIFALVAAPFALLAALALLDRLIR